MNIVSDDTVPRNTGWAREIRDGQVLRLFARTIIDFVALDADDPDQAFDQAPTKEENACIYLKRGHRLMSRSGLCLMTMTEDGFAGLGTHDMQFGMCGRARHARAAEEDRLGEYLHNRIELPDHGCSENLGWALTPFGIPYENIPSPVNLFQNMAIDQKTGVMSRTPTRPASPVPVSLRAERDLIVAFSACPDLASPDGGQAVRAVMLEE